MTFVLFSYLLCFPSKNTSKLFFPISHPTFFMLSSSCSSIRSANRSITVESVLLTTNRLPLSITLSVKPRIRKTIYVHHLTLRRLFFTISPQFMRCQYMRATAIFPRISESKRYEASRTERSCAAHFSTFLNRFGICE